jgi:flagellar biosynthetic protein FliP
VVPVLIKKYKIPFLIIILLIICFSTVNIAAPTIPFPKLEIGIGTAENADDLVVTLEIILFLTVISLAPSILMMFTSFTRIMVVMSILRNAMGTRQSPPNQVLVALALFLTMFIMWPTFMDTWDNAYVPYSEGEIDYQEMFGRTGNIFKEFMVKELKIHHNEDNVDMLIESTGREYVDDIADAGLEIIVPAFIVGELEIAFKMGVLLYIPFIVIDMVTASILLAMGMIMIPPVLISMPFKILLFVIINGWDLLIGGLIRSFG